MPAIQPIARKIIAFIRSPNWILRPVGMGQRVYNPEELEDFAQKPELLMALRKTNEAVMNSVFSKAIPCPLRKDQLCTKST